MTLQTIADALHVSRSTVSNAYNRPDQLAPELRERILSTARELGYAGPDPAARRLRTGHSGVIGLLFTEALSYAFTDPGATGFLSGLSRAGERSATSLLLLAAPPGDEARSRIRDAVVDGFCVYSMSEGHPAVEAVLERGAPTLIVDEPRIPGVPFLGIDDRGGARLAAAHVAHRGHRRVGIVSARLLPDDFEGEVTPDRLAAATFSIERDRLAGFREALEPAGIDWASVPIVERHNDQRSGHEAARRLLEGDPAPTALLCTTDQLALGALRAGAELGADLAVTGFDDVPEAARAGLTTVRQPLVGKGVRAGELLLDLMQDGRPADELMPVELVVRQSA